MPVRSPHIDTPRYYLNILESSSATTTVAQPLQWRDRQEARILRSRERSEQDLERQLDRTRAANLVERAETSIRATGPQTAG